MTQNVGRVLGQGINVTIQDQNGKLDIGLVRLGDIMKFSHLHIFIILVILGLTLKVLYSEPPIQPQPKPTPSVPDKPKPEPKPSVVQPEFYEVPIQRVLVKENSIYADIINHCQRPDLQYTRDTNAHESTHGINADIRNYFNSKNRNNPRVNAFYILGGKAVVVEEPHIRKRDAINYIPQSLRGSRYNLYIRGQNAWDDTPLYIMDEWSSYINGAEVSVEDSKSGKNKQRYDAVKGALEFTVYSTAICMAVKDKDPQYWENNKQFKRFVLLQLKRSYNIFHEGIQIEQFQGYNQTEYLNNLKKSPDANKMRQFLINEFQGIWLD